MKTAIITTGDEILIGQIVDTNSGWMSAEMTKAGFEIDEIITVGDDVNQIKGAIDNAFKQVDVILMTGGLGPTKDDITKKTLCEYFDTEIIFSEAVFENIKQVIQMPSAMNKLTKAQAYIPNDCTLIQNRVGTAPVTWFERDGKVLVSLPGVPYEMRYNMEHEIIPRLKNIFGTKTYIYKVLLIKSYAESSLAIHLEDFEDNLPIGFGLAYLPSPRLVKLRLFVQGEHRLKEFDEQLEKLKYLLEDSILSEEDAAIEKILGDKLFSQKMTLATAESCTGGRIAHLITSIAGSSAYFEGSVVAYSYEAKEKMLGVKNEDLNKYGAVSQEIVIEMANGLQDVLGVNCAIAVSGIAGPAGGTNDKPVGTVWIATKVNDKVTTKRYRLGKYREANIMGASNLAMLQLLEML